VNWYHEAAELPERLTSLGGAVNRAWGLPARRASCEKDAVLMIEPILPADPLVQQWLDRHPRPTSFILHMIGIPPTILGVLFVPIYLSLLSLPIFLLALALFVGGYVLQFLGHLFEGTDPGEVIYFKRKLGLPYVEFPVPRSRREA
jgi:Protein of unknown function (DUF962)